MRMQSLPGPNSLDGAWFEARYYQNTTYRYKYFYINVYLIWNSLYMNLKSNYLFYNTLILFGRSKTCREALASASLNARLIQHFLTVLGTANSALQGSLRIAPSCTALYLDCTQLVSVSSRCVDRQSVRSVESNCFSRFFQVITVRTGSDLAYPTFR